MCLWLFIARYILQVSLYTRKMLNTEIMSSVNDYCQ